MAECDLPAKRRCSVTIFDQQGSQCDLCAVGYEVDTLASVPLMGGVYSTGNTCLHLAAQNGHLEMVECLLDRAANPRLIDYR